MKIIWKLILLQFWLYFLLWLTVHIDCCIIFWSYFIEADILDLLKYPVTRTKISPDAIEDIQDGLLYKKHFEADGFFKGTSKEKKVTEVHISFQINTDGVALFRSSKYSIWPVYLVINELPPNCRFVLRWFLLLV